MANLPKHPIQTTRHKRLLPAWVGLILGCHIITLAFMLVGFTGPVWLVMAPVYTATFLGLGTALYALVWRRWTHGAATIATLSFGLTMGVYGTILPLLCRLNTPLSFFASAIWTVQVFLLLLALWVLKANHWWSSKALFAPFMSIRGLMWAVPISALAVYMAIDGSSTNADYRLYLVYIARALDKGVVNATDIFASGEGVMVSYPYNVWLTLLAVPSYLFDWSLSDTWHYVVCFTAPLVCVAIYAMVRELSGNRRLGLFVVFSVVVGHLILGDKLPTDYRYYIFNEGTFWDWSPFPRNLAWFVLLPAFLISIYSWRPGTGLLPAAMTGLIFAAMASFHLPGLVYLGFAMLAVSPYLLKRFIARGQGMRLVGAVALAALIVLPRLLTQLAIMKEQGAVEADLGLWPGHLERLYDFYGTFAHTPFCVFSFWIAIGALIFGGRFGRKLAPVMLLFGMVAMVNPVKAFLVSFLPPSIFGRIAITATFFGWVLAACLIYQGMVLLIQRASSAIHWNVMVAGSLLLLVPLTVFADRVQRKVRIDLLESTSHKEMAALESLYARIDRHIPKGSLVLSLNFKPPWSVACLSGLNMLPDGSFGNQAIFGSTVDLVERNRDLMPEFQRYNHYEAADRINPSEKELLELYRKSKKHGVAYILTHSQWKLNAVLHQQDRSHMFRPVVQEGIAALWEVVH